MSWFKGMQLGMGLITWFMGAFADKKLTVKEIGQGIKKVLGDLGVPTSVPILISKDVADGIGNGFQKLGEWIIKAGADGQITLDEGVEVIEVGLIQFGVPPEIDLSGSKE